MLIYFVLKQIIVVIDKVKLRISANIPEQMQFSLLKNLNNIRWISSYHLIWQESEGLIH